MERRIWSEDQNQRWHELRAAYQRAADAVRAHPLLVQAAAEGGLWTLETQLRTQVPQVQVVVRRDQDGLERAVVLMGGVEQDEKAAA